MHVVLGNTLGSIRNLFFFDEVSLFKKIVSILEKIRLLLKAIVWKRFFSSVFSFVREKVFVNEKVENKDHKFRIYLPNDSKLVLNSKNGDNSVIFFLHNVKFIRCCCICITKFS